MPRGWRLLRLREPEGPALLGAIHPDSPRLISLIEGTSLVDVLELGDIEERAAAAETVEALDEETLELPEPWELVVPLDAPETWAAGVTYERSREARLEESRTEARDAYSLVYDAERPELFLKDAAGRRTAGPGGTIGVRSDSTWTVPEPEVALVLGTDGRLLGATIGNDVSSRDIEGMNPLYLPQAKIFGGACALGPAVLAPQDWSDPFDIELRIVASDGGAVYSGATSTGRMKRSFADLVAFLLRDNPVPPGSVLLTGTGVVPDDVSLEPGQTVEIRVAGIGTLVNRVAPAAEVLVW
ncbi:MAG: fumarylacetoacetate hydrolase family protein [Actinomycetota bacterium]|nr:fumarylacetoacetate hydrolase family protein [Actinomycetota bacterium]